MEVWHDILEGIGLSVIILVAVIGNYICPLGTKATIYYDRRTGELLEIVTRTTLKQSLTKFQK